jgi:succinate-acetate transporter protein
MDTLYLILGVLVVGLLLTAIGALARNSVLVRACGYLMITGAICAALYLSPFGHQIYVTLADAR